MFNLAPLTYAGGIGVIDMELLSVIRRWRYRDHFSIREISRRTGLSRRNTVRKYLRSDTVEPRFNIPDRPGCLMQLSRPFDGFVEYAKRVSPTCLVHLD